MCRFWVRWRDAVQGALSAVWRATQARSNAAMRPVVLPKMGYWLFSPPLPPPILLLTAIIAIFFIAANAFQVRMPD